jgi:hypothetical protein
VGYVVLSLYRSVFSRADEWCLRRQDIFELRPEDKKVHEDHAPGPSLAVDIHEIISIHSAVFVGPLSQYGMFVLSLL